jgi:hypothetical protein
VDEHVAGVPDSDEIEDGIGDEDDRYESNSDAKTDGHAVEPRRIRPCVSDDAAAMGTLLFERSVTGEPFRVFSPGAGATLLMPRILTPQSESTLSHPQRQALKEVRL